MFHWIQLIPYIFTLVDLAERVLGSGSGNEKKELVVGGAKIAVDAVSNLSTGGQKQTWNALGPVVSKLIDFAAAFLFPKGTTYEREEPEGE